MSDFEHGTIEELRYSDFERSWFGMSSENRRLHVSLVWVIDWGIEAVRLKFDQRDPGIIKDLNVKVPHDDDSEAAHHERARIASVLGLDISDFAPPNIIEVTKRQLKQLEKDEAHRRNQFNVAGEQCGRLASFAVSVDVGLASELYEEALENQDVIRQQLEAKWYGAMHRIEQLDQ